MYYDIPEPYIDQFLKKINAREKTAQVIKLLNDSGLVKTVTPYTGKGEKAPSHFVLHELVHQLIRERIPVEEKKNLIATAAKIMLDILREPNKTLSATYYNDPIHLLHAEKLCQSAYEIQYFNNPDIVKLSARILRWLMYTEKQGILKRRK